MSEQDVRPSTLGEKRIRTSFNVSGDNYIDLLKTKSAELIDLVNEAAGKKDWDDATNGEFRRLKSLAQTAYEEAAMWAVKAATI